MTSYTTDPKAIRHQNPDLLIKEWSARHNCGLLQKSFLLPVCGNSGRPNPDHRRASGAYNQSAVARLSATHRDQNEKLQTPALQTTSRRILEAAPACDPEVRAQ